MDREDVIRLAREAGFNVKHLFGEDEVCEQEYEYWRENPDIGQDVITHTVERFAALVTEAAKGEWVGLTDEEFNDCLVAGDPCENLAEPEAWAVMKEVEAKLKEKNHK